MRFRYSSSVVAPMQRNSPRAKAGFKEIRRVHRSFGSARAHDGVNLVDEQRTICPAAVSTSLSTALSRSSNSPRYFAPATSAPMSSDTSRLFLSDSGTSPRTMRCAMPSTIAVFPTPGSPMSTGLFLVRRERNLHHAPNLFIAPDHGVAFSAPRLIRQVTRCTCRAPETFPRIAIDHTLAPTHRRQCRKHAVVVDLARLLEQRLHVAIGLRHREHVMFDGNEVVFERLRLVFARRTISKRRREKARLRTARHLGNPSRRRVRLAVSCPMSAARFLQQGTGNTALLLKRREQNVLGVKFRVASARRDF